jgi:class 3 adenylate cyclase
MKRKIAAIFAADIAGYSKLVAEDEEETLRRLASYRSVMDDFIARAGGRIFNTAGDAVLAEFPSAVEAVRCAIDIQESLRTRNMAYPASRQMSFRIGITVGDVVERDGDLLGDGVNIAARLEGIAPIGGICISRTVHEQVANKLSVVFADIGEQHVKNIPTPVHAYMFAMRPDDARPEPLAKKPASRPVWLWPAVLGAVCAVGLGVAAIVYFTTGRPGAQDASNARAPPATTERRARAQPAPRPTEALVPEAVPLIADRARAIVRDEYIPAADHKALAISTGPIGFISSQADDETAKIAALDMCQKRADATSPSRRCELYAIGNTVVYVRGHPPMPPLPWLTRDASVETPLVAKDIPLARENNKALIEKNYLPGRKSKAIAMSSSGLLGYYFSQESIDEAVRRALESCGSNAGVPCMIIAVDDVFIVPIPTTMKVMSYFRPASSTAIAQTLRTDLANRLGNAIGGWTAVAAGAGGQPGVMLKAASEQEAVDGALADCAKQDRSCRVVAIGPFAVEPK